MSNSHIHLKVREYLAANTRQAATAPLSYHHTGLAHITTAHPALTPHQIRSICKAQEKQILEKVLPIKPYNLYEQMAKVCPYERDIRHISNEEVSTRLSQCSSKVYPHVSNSPMESESDSGNEWDQSEGEMCFGNFNFATDCMEEESDKSDHELLNIFEICQNHAFGHPEELEFC